MARVWVEPYPTKREEMHRIRIRHDDGSNESYHETFFSKSKANKKAQEISDLLAEGKRLKARKQFGQRAKDYLAWLDARIAAGDPRMKKNTRRICADSLSDILPRFGDCFLDELTPADLNKFKNELLRDHNVGGVNRILIDLRTFLNWCVGEGDLDKSPFDPKKVKLFESKFIGYFFSRQELALIYKHARISEAGACGGPTQRLWWAIYVLKETGMRVGEFLNIQWSDLQENAVWVTGKTGKRLVPLPKVARHCLVKLLECPWSHNIEKAWRTMILKTGIVNPNYIDRKTGKPKPPRIHDLRHSFASTYLAKGNSVANLMEIGGWERLESLEKYTHPDIPNLLKTMEKRHRG